MEGIREIGVIWGAELGRTLKSARVVVLLLLYLMFTLIALMFFHYAARLVSGAIDQQVQAGLDPDKVELVKDQERTGFITWAFGADETMTEALAVIPLVLLIVFKTTLRFLPLYTGIMGFDQISGEVGTGSIRYLTVRSRRSSVLFGKFLAQATILALLMLIIDLALCVYARFANADFGTGAMLRTLAKFWFSAIVFSLAYLALTSLCSTIFRQPAVSLVVNLIALSVIWLVALIGDFFPLESRPEVIPGRGPVEASPLAYLRFVSVWHYNNELLHPKFSHSGVAALAHLGFTALFLGSAWLVLRRRDL